MLKLTGILSQKNIGILASWITIWRTFDDFNKWQYSETIQLGLGARKSWRNNTFVGRYIFFALVKSQYSILDLNHLTIFFQGSVAPALFGRSALTVKGSLGETAVGFDFAPPTISTSVSAGEEPSTNPTIYPVFILWGDGRIFFVATTIGKVIHPKCFLKTDLIF